MPYDFYRLFVCATLLLPFPVIAGTLYNNSHYETTCSYCSELFYKDGSSCSCSSGQSVYIKIKSTQLTLDDNGVCLKGLWKRSRKDRQRFWGFCYETPEKKKHASWKIKKYKRGIYEAIATCDGEPPEHAMDPPVKFRILKTKKFSDVTVTTHFSSKAERESHELIMNIQDNSSTYTLNNGSDGLDQTVKVINSSSGKLIKKYKIPSTMCNGFAPLLTYMSAVKSSFPENGLGSCVLSCES